MFSGKGGVGKTTMSVSLAMSLSSSHRVFLLSTDPAGSLGDIFGEEVTGRVLEVSKNLTVLELTRDNVIKRWREKFGDEVYTVVSSLLPVGREILDYFEGAPGIDEEFILDLLLDLSKSKEYNYIVWDTAPTSSTLSLLRIQLLFYSHLTEAQKLYLGLKGFLKKIKDGASPLDLIRKWRGLTEDVINMLRNETLCWVVAIPERLPIVQALRLKDEIKNFGMEVKGFIVNRCIPLAEAKKSDFLMEKYKLQRRWVKYIEERSDVPVKIIEELDISDLSMEDYKNIGKKLLHELL